MGEGRSGGPQQPLSPLRHQKFSPLRTSTEFADTDPRKRRCLESTLLCLPGEEATVVLPALKGAAIASPPRARAAMSPHHPPLSKTVVPMAKTLAQKPLCIHLTLAPPAPQQVHCALNLRAIVTPCVPASWKPVSLSQQACLHPGSGGHSCSARARPGPTTTAHTTAPQTPVPPW